MYPTLLAGVVVVVAAVRYALRGDPNRLRLVRNLQLLVLLVGVLGFTTGIIHAFTSLPENATPYDAGRWAIVAIGEALNCVGLALVSLVMSTIATAFGAHRASAGKSGGATLADPHRP
jgi:hypothetical protein